MSMLLSLSLLYGWFQQVVVLSLALLVALIVWHRRSLSQTKDDYVVVMAFFHPHCSGGGGGERVLWKMIQVLGNIVDHNNTTQRKTTTTYQVVIYTVDPVSDTYEQDIRQHVLERFSLVLSTQLSLSFVHLNEYAHLLRPARSFSLLVESLGAMRLAYHALRKSSAPPHIFVDTTGCAFTYVPAVVLFGCRVLAYVHYPTISTDMLKLVWERRRTAYNHSEYIANSTWNTYIKLVYYVGFAILYGAVGSLATQVMVNSTWTYHHIRSLWKFAAWRNRIRIVYPPCSLPVQSSSSSSASSNNQRKPVILSIGQFRPEKDHVLQIESMARLLQTHPELRTTSKLVLIGSCRENAAADRKRLEQLQSLCQSMNIHESVEFVVNQPFPVLRSWLDTATAGIHTMWNEHFGIGIVEMMAAGLIVVAHNSGGPKSDIVVPLSTSSWPSNPQHQERQLPNSATTKTTDMHDNNIVDDELQNQVGFLASSADEYADCLYRILTMNDEQADQIRKNAQLSATRFTDEVFAKAFQDVLWEQNIY